MQVFRQEMEQSIQLNQHYDFNTTTVKVSVRTLKQLKTS